jgi:hypothetical protein
MATPVQDMYAAVTKNDVDLVRAILEQHPDLLEQWVVDKTWLHLAAAKNSVDVAAYLIDAGLSVDALSEDGNDVPLHNAARNGSLDVAQLLLDRGASVDGVSDHVSPLISAITKGDEDMVRVLIERGADAKKKYGDPRQNAVDVANTFGQAGIAAYLRDEVGIAGEGGAAEADDEIVAHIEKHRGPVRPAALTDESSDMQILVMIPEDEENAAMIITKGMSDMPMIIPKGKEEFQFAELVMYLPSDWPLDLNDMQDPNNAWPVEWLRRMANFPFTEDTWLGEFHATIANEDPPKPLGPGTDCRCLLIIHEPGEFGRLKAKDGRIIHFYNVFPLYVEEYKLEQREGIRALMTRLQDNGIPPVYYPKRPNVGQ